MSEQDFEQQIRFMIEDAEKERDKLNRRISSAQEGLVIIEAKLDAYRQTLRDYCEFHGIPFQENTTDEALRAEFAELTTKDALIRIGRARGGVIVARDACRVLVQAQMFKNPRNASGNIYSAFQRFPNIFRRIDKGTYLLTEPSNAPRVSVSGTVVRPEHLEDPPVGPQSAYGEARAGALGAAIPKVTNMHRW